MIRNISATGAGLIIGIVIVTLGILLSRTFIIAPETAFSPEDTEAIKSFMNSQSITAYIPIWIFDGLGVFFAAFVAGKISVDSKLNCSIIAAGFILIAIITRDFSAFYPFLYIGIDLIFTLVSASLAIRTHT